MSASKKTSQAKSKDRKVYSQTAGKPKAAGSPKATKRTKAITKFRAAATLDSAAGKPKPAAKPKFAQQRKVVQQPKTAKAMPSLKTVVLDALADMKALEVKVMDVRGLTDIADFMVIASGTSDRHVRSAAQRVVEKAKQAGFRPHGVEGQQDSDWVLVDLN